MTQAEPFHGVIPFFPHGPPTGHRSRGAGAEASAAAAASRGKSRSPRGRIVLLTWELGARGHLAAMLPLAWDLDRAGYNVQLMVRDVVGAGSVSGPAMEWSLAAPRWPRPAPHPPPPTYSHLLLQLGYNNYVHLEFMARVWRDTMSMLEPDLIVFSHSPTALLASRALHCRRALIGPGLSCPPENSTEAHPQAPWALFSSNATAAVRSDTLVAAERRLLERMNRVLDEWRLPPLEHPGQLFSDVDETFLTTFPELDPFPGRRSAGYWGPVLLGAGLGGNLPPEWRDAPFAFPQFNALRTGGETPDWPDIPGRRIFACLKPCPALSETLTALADAGHPTVVYVEGIESAVRRRFTSPSLRFFSEAPNLRLAARDCALAVVHGAHAETVALLLAGRPLLLVPPSREQRLTAEAVERLGAGAVPPAETPGAVRRGLEALLGDDRYAMAARRYSDRYAAFDPERQRRNVLARAQELLA